MTLVVLSILLGIIANSLLGFLFVKLLDQYALVIIYVIIVAIDLGLLFGFSRRTGKLLMHDKKEFTVLILFLTLALTVGLALPIMSPDPYVLSWDGFVQLYIVKGLILNERRLLLRGLFTDLNPTVAEFPYPLGFSYFLLTVMKIINSDGISVIKYGNALPLFLGMCLGYLMFKQVEKDNVTAASLSALMVLSLNDWGSVIGFNWLLPSSIGILNSIGAILLLQQRSLLEDKNSKNTLLFYALILLVFSFLIHVYFAVVGLGLCLLYVGFGKIPRRFLPVLILFSVGAVISSHVMKLPLALEGVYLTSVSRRMTLLAEIAPLSVLLPGVAYSANMVLSHVRKDSLRESASRIPLFAHLSTVLLLILFLFNAGGVHRLLPYPLYFCCISSAKAWTSFLERSKAFIMFLRPGKISRIPFSGVVGFLLIVSLILPGFGFLNTQFERSTYEADGKKIPTSYSLSEYNAITWLSRRFSNESVIVVSEPFLARVISAITGQEAYVPWDQKALSLKEILTKLRHDVFSPDALIKELNAYPELNARKILLIFSPRVYYWINEDVSKVYRPMPLNCIDGTMRDNLISSLYLHRIYSDLEGVDIFEVLSNRKKTSEASISLSLSVPEILEVRGQYAHIPRIRLEILTDSILIPRNKVERNLI